MSYFIHLFSFIIVIIIVFLLLQNYNNTRRRFNIRYKQYREHQIRRYPIGNYIYNASSFIYFILVFFCLS